VKGLPKDALIEKQVLYHTGRGYSAIDDEEEGDNTAHQAVSCPSIYNTESFVEGNTEVRSEGSYLQHLTASAAVICGRGTSNWENVSQRLKAAAHLEGRLTRALSVRLFYKVTSISEADLPATQSLFHPSSPAITPVPCRCISTRDHGDWEYALCILSA